MGGIQADVSLKPNLHPQLHTFPFAAFWWFVI